MTLWQNHPITANCSWKKNDLDLNTTLKSRFIGFQSPGFLSTFAKTRRKNQRMPIGGVFDLCLPFWGARGHGGLHVTKWRVQGREARWASHQGNTPPRRWEKKHICWGWVWGCQWPAGLLHVWDPGIHGIKPAFSHWYWEGATAW